MNLIILVVRSTEMAFAGTGLSPAAATGCRRTTAPEDDRPQFDPQIVVPGRAKRPGPSRSPIRPVAPARLPWRKVAATAVIDETGADACGTTSRRPAIPYVEGRRAVEPPGRIDAVASSIPCLAAASGVRIRGDVAPRIQNKVNAGALISLQSATAGADAPPGADLGL